MTEEEKCLELLEAVKESRGVSHEIYFWVKAEYDSMVTAERVSYLGLVDNLINESIDYCRCNY